MKTSLWTIAMIGLAATSLSHPAAETEGSSLAGNFERKRGTR